MKKKKFNFDSVKTKVKTLDKNAAKQLKGGFVIGAADIESA